MPKPAQSRLCSTRKFARQRGISRQRVLAQLTPLENALLADFAGRVRVLAGARLARIAKAVTRKPGRS